MMRRFFMGAAALTLALASAGCSRSPRVTFYTLDPAIKGEAAATGKTAPAVAVGPVTLPEVVDRPQLVVRVAANRVAILEFHRWAEPLKSEIPRLIAQNLGRLLGSNRIASYHQFSGAAPDYRVLVDIIRLESVPGDAVTLEANWSVRRGRGTAPKTGHTVVREKVAGEDYDAIVVALNRVFAGLSVDIANMIRAEATTAR